MFVNYGTVMLCMYFTFLSHTVMCRIFRVIFWAVAKVFVY